MSNDNYKEDSVIRDVDGVVIAIITYRLRSNGSKTWSYSFMREFDQDGALRRTCWLNARHSEAVGRLIPRVEEYIAKKEFADEDY